MCWVIVFSGTSAQTLLKTPPKGGFDEIVNNCAQEIGVFQGKEVRKFHVGIVFQSSTV